MSDFATLEELGAVVDRLSRSDIPEAARIVVRLLTDDELLDHRIWASEDEPKRRAAALAKAQGATDAVGSMRETVPVLAPSPAAFPEDSPWHGRDYILQWEPGKPFINGDLVLSDGEVYAVRSAAPVYDPPSAGSLLWERMAPPVPEPAEDAAIADDDSGSVGAEQG